MKVEELLDVVKDALGVDSVSVDDSMQTIEEWDSLSQLEILVGIDSATNGEASKMKELAKALSVKELINVLRGSGLIDE
jgi:acyl carrier protein